MAAATFTMRQLRSWCALRTSYQTLEPKNGIVYFGERNGIHIIDLQQTVPLFSRALEAMRDTAAKGGRILFVGTKRAAADKIAETAKPVVSIM